MTKLTGKPDKTSQLARKIINSGPRVKTTVSTKAKTTTPKKKRGKP